MWRRKKNSLKSKLKITKFLPLFPEILRIKNSEIFMHFPKFSEILVPEMFNHISRDIPKLTETDSEYRWNSIGQNRKIYHKNYIERIL